MSPSHILFFFLIFLESSLPCGCHSPPFSLSSQKRTTEVYECMGVTRQNGALCNCRARLFMSSQGTRMWNVPKSTCDAWSEKKATTDNGRRFGRPFFRCISRLNSDHQSNCNDVCISHPYRVHWIKLIKVFFVRSSRKIWL